MTSFFDNVKEALESNELDKFKQIFYSSANENNIADFSWDLADLFNTHLLTTCDNNLALDTSIKEASIYLCNHKASNSKELFLVYLENSQYYLKNDANFIFFMDLIKLLLERQSIKFIFYSIESALNEFLKYINSKHPTISSQSILLINKLIDFIETFLIKNHMEVEENYDLKMLLTIILINFFNQPSNVLTNQDQIDLENLSNKIYGSITKVNCNLFELIIKLQNKTETKMAKTMKNISVVNKLALSSFLTFILSEKVIFTFENELRVNAIPLVYNPLYKLIQILPIISHLLNDPNNEINLKTGLNTISLLIKSIDIMAINSSVLEVNYVDNFLRLMLKMMVFSTFETIRKESKNIFMSFFNCLTRQDRFMFIFYYLKFTFNCDENETSSNYVSAFLIYLFKEELDSCFVNNENDSLTSFNIKKIFILVTKLPQKLEFNDLTQYSSRIISTLNMIRFVVLKDSLNKTGFVNLIQSNENTFFKDLNKAIQHSKEHYKKELQTLSNDSNENKVRDEVGLNAIISNDNKKLNEPSINEKITSINLSLHTIDIIESLIIRVSEIIHERVK